MLLLVLVAVIAIIGLLFAFPLSGGESFVAPKTTDDIVITIHGDRNTQVLKGEDYIEAGAYAIDKNEGPVAKSVEISGNAKSRVMTGRRPFFMACFQMTLRSSTPFARAVRT